MRNSCTASDERCRSLATSQRFSPLSSMIQLSPPSGGLDKAWMQVDLVPPGSYMRTFTFSVGTCMERAEPFKHLLHTLPTVHSQFLMFEKPRNGTNLTCTYPIFIFDVDTSSFVSKALHCALIVFPSRNVQGSSLIVRKNKQRE